MNETNLTVLLVIAEILFSIIVLFFMKKAGAKKLTLISTSVTMMLWLYTVYYLISNSFFSGTNIPQLTFSIGVFLPVVIILIFKNISQDFNKVIKNMSTSDFLNLQQYRALFGVLFFFTTVLPSWFQYIGGLGDIAAGLAAIFTLIMFKNKKSVTFFPSQAKIQLLKVLVHKMDIYYYSVS